MPQTILRAEHVEKYYAQRESNRLIWRRLYRLAETRYKLEG